MGQLPSAPPPPAAEHAWRPDTERGAARPRSDAYAVVALAAALAAVGFLFGPVTTVAFAWAFGIVGAVAGSYTRTPGAAATTGIAVGILSALGALLALMLS